MPWWQSEGANVRQQPKLWDSQRERGKKREREKFPTKSSNLRHSWTCSQNKRLSKYQRRASWLWTGPSPHWRKRGRWAAARSRRQGATILAPETGSSTKLAAGSQWLTKSSWDPRPLTSSRRVTVRDQLPRGDTAHLRQHSLCTLRKLRSWDQGGDKMHWPPGTVRLSSTQPPELLRPGKGTKRRPNWVYAFVEYPRTWNWAA